MRIAGAAFGAAIAAMIFIVGRDGVAAPRQAELAIENVTVIDPERRRILPNRSVIVDRGRIVAVVAAATSRVPADATVDGRGRFLIPGLMDMHVHLFLNEPQAPSLRLLLANGVTGIREMSGDCYAAAGAKRGCIADYRALQARLRSGEEAGPEIVELASAMVMGPTRLTLPAGAPKWVTPATPDEMRRMMADLADRGAELVKTHDSVPTAAFPVLMAEANRRGLKVGGHVPFAVGALGAARLGYDSIEHARDLPYDCSRFGPEFRRREAAYADRLPGAARPGNVERLRRTVTEFDGALCAALLRRLAASGAYYTPTHVTREMEARAGDPAYVADPNRRFIPRGRAASWAKDLAETAALPFEERTALAAFYRHGLKITALAHRAGVPIMAGTDTSDTMIVPGFSLHRELRLLAEAGLSPMDVLRAATTVPARYLARADLGGIAPGKRADLVLLASNPLSDIANTAAIEQVIVGGRRYDRAGLDALLAQAATIAAAR